MKEPSRRGARRLASGFARLVRALLPVSLAIAMLALIGPGAGPALAATTPAPVQIGVYNDFNNNDTRAQFVVAYDLPGVSGGQSQTSGWFSYGTGTWLTIPGNAVNVVIQVRGDDYYRITVWCTYAFSWAVNDLIIAAGPNACWNGSWYPTVLAGQPGVTVSAGQTATMTGMVADPDGDAVTLSASAGTVTSNGDGTWSWSYPTSSPAQSQTVTVTATDSHGQSWTTSFGLVVNQAATATGLSLSAATVTYGNEQTEQFTATVTPANGGTPTGTVAVAESGVTLCTITLAAGTGSCPPAAATLPPGSYQVTATYTGDAGFTGSASPAQALTVTKTATTTSLTLSAATITYGHETTETLTVGVHPRYAGAPTGTVTIKALTTTSTTITVCTITLASGAGSCTLTATKLPPGTYKLTATYHGNTDFKRSTSTAQTLTVLK